MTPDPAFWRGKRVLLTGHTGFKGSWLAIWLHRLGAIVTGLALAPDAEGALFERAAVSRLLRDQRGDIRDAGRVAALVRDADPQIVLHLAAQALVRAGYRDPLATFSTNFMGTANVLDALRSAPSIRVAVMVTTDKVYKGKPAPRAHDEEDALGGRDPYSASKAASELLISSYRDSYLAERGVRVASARAGNVVGGGDWAADRLIPDALRAWTAGDVLHVRSPGAVRPWQHVLEPLAAYLRLAQACWERPPPATSYNFGPGSARAVTVRQVVEIAREKFGGGLIRFGEGVDGPIESDWLALQVSRAERDLGVHGRWSIEESVGRAIDWYRGCGNGVTARALCDADIDAFEAVR